MSEEVKIEATVQYELKMAKKKIEAELMRRERWLVLCDLAERLFVADYPSATEYTSKRIAKEAFDAAEAFLAEAERRAEACK